MSYPEHRYSDSLPSLSEPRSALVCVRLNVHHELGFWVGAGVTVRRDTTVGVRIRNIYGGRGKVDAAECNATPKKQGEGGRKETKANNHGHVVSYFAKSWRRQKTKRREGTLVCVARMLRYVACVTSLTFRRDFAA